MYQTPAEQGTAYTVATPYYTEFPMEKAIYHETIEQAERLELNALELAEQGHEGMARILKDKAGMLRLQARALEITDSRYE